MKKSLSKAFFLLVVLLVTTAFFGIIGDFLMAGFWAIVMAVIFYPCYEKILKRFPQKSNLSAILTLAFILMLVIIPLGIVSLAVINEATNVYQNVMNDEETLQQKIASVQQKIPLSDEQLQLFGLTTEGIKEKLEENLANGAKFMAGKALGFTQNLFGFFVNFFLMLYILFFFLRDGKRLIQELIWVLPIGDQQEWTLLKRFESVARATVKGSLLVATLQGTIGGILFWAVGIPAAFLWGVIMILASLLPVGSVLIWGPWAVAMFLQGNYGKGIILIAVGAGFIGLIDNLLRPKLVGQDAKMPDYLVLISTLGGLTWFGLSGFVIGPIVAALFMSCWEMMGDTYGKPYQTVVTATPTEEAVPPSEIEETKE